MFKISYRKKCTGKQRARLHLSRLSKTTRLNLSYFIKHIESKKKQQVHCIIFYQNNENNEAEQEGTKRQSCNQQTKHQQTHTRPLVSMRNVCFSNAKCKLLGPSCFYFGPFLFYSLVLSSCIQTWKQRNRARRNEAPKSQPTKPNSNKQILDRLSLCKMYVCFLCEM